MFRVFGALERHRERNAVWYARNSRAAQLNESEQNRLEIVLHDSFESESG
jgi:hypothetical protein